MSFQPVVPVSGYAGWKFLTRTLEQQQAAFARAPALQRDMAYFRDNIAGVASAEALVSDRRLLRVALDAFGLGADVNNRAFIRKVLEDGTADPRALANRLADRRYQAFSNAFGLSGTGVPAPRTPGFADRIAGLAAERRFEEALGAQDGSMRLALGLRRDLSALAEQPGSENARWFTVMGTPPLRKVFETAFGLPPSFAALDIDRQLDVFKSRAATTFGDTGIAQFRDPERLEALVQRFLLRDGAAAGASANNPANVALQLLQSMPRRF
jgi:hypothetical protein